MLTKLYFAIWAFVGVIAAVLFVAGSMTTMVLTIFGFVAFGLVFMGMMGVLPIAVSHPSVRKPAEPNTALKASARETAAKVSGAVASYFDPKNVQVQKPRHP